MRIPISLLATGLALALLVGACSDDTDVKAGDEPAGDGAGSGAGDTDATVPGSVPDLVGTITSVEPFEPVTEGCTPAEDLDPDAAVSSDDPPVCTPEDNEVVGTILAEEEPGDPTGGRKISFRVTPDSVIVLAGRDGAEGKVGAFGDLAEGQVVETWIPSDGMCAESYPEQCLLAALRVTG